MPTFGPGQNNIQMESAEFITNLSVKNQSQKKFVTGLQELSFAELTKKKDEKTWCVLECVEHMNKATELYLNQMDKKMHLLKPDEKHVFKKTWLASKFTNGLAPTPEGEIKNKMKTTKVFRPSGEMTPSTLDQFLNNADRIEKILVQAKNMDLRSFKVTTALGPILKFYLGDALDFILAHNDRHVVQIKTILQNQ